jgi:hypothetical protein
MYQKGARMATTVTFFLSQVATVLGMPETLVKNWTIGKPVRIDLHRGAVGTGFPNLYDVHDLYRFATAKRLSLDGLTPSAIQSILDGLGEDFTSAEFAVVTSDARHYLPRSKGIKVQVQRFSQSQFDQDDLSSISNQFRSSIGCHVLYIAGITEDVNQRVDKFMQKNFGKRRTQQRLSRRPEKVEIPAITRKFRTLENE